LQQQRAQPSSKPIGHPHRGVPVQVRWAVRCLVGFVLLNLVIVQTCL